MMIVDCIVYALQYLHGTGSVVDFCRRLTADGQAVDDALAQHGLGSLWAPAAKMQLSVAGHEPKARCRPWTDASAKIKRLMGGIWMMMRITETGMMNRDSRQFEPGAVALPWRERSAAAVWTLGLVMASLVLIAALRVDARAVVAGDPMATVKSTVDQVVGVLQDRSASQQSRRERLLQVVADRFDFADMARQTLGAHWKDLTPGQQQQFVPLFTSFMEDAYLNKIEDYSGQPINFLRQSSDGSGYAQVSTSVMQSDKQAVRVDYRLRQEGNDWKVYDVAVDDISITANYRNQFNRVINSQGYEALVNTMRSKQQELQGSLAG